jgi:Tfp pilus assembly protein PilF
MMASVVSNRGALAVVIALTCASCASPPAQKERTPSPATAPGGRVPAPPQKPSLSLGKGEQDFRGAVANYEDGAYKDAARQFQAALDAGLDAKSDRASAHKYLAFIDCVAGREKLCRDEFRKALDADPDFDLAPAEAGHPIWGPALFKA